MILSIILTPWFQAVQKGPNARRARNRRAEAYLPIRWSEAIERNEAVGPFSTACLQDDTHSAMICERFQVENGFPVMDLQLSVHPFQSVLVATDIRTRFAHAETVDEKR